MLMSNDSSKAAFVHVLLFLLASNLGVSAAQMKTVDDFRAAATKANAVLTIPDWEQTPESSIRRSLLSQRHENHRLFSFGPRKRLSSTRGERVGREQMRLYWNRST